MDATPGYPDRIEMRDAEVGETVLLNHTYLADGPYRGSHAIFVREGAERRYESVGAVPDVMARRQLYVRGFDADGLMVAAELIDGADAAQTFERLLSDPAVDALLVHNAVRGCYSGRVERA